MTQTMYFGLPRKRYIIHDDATGYWTLYDKPGRVLFHGTAEEMMAFMEVTL